MKYTAIMIMLLGSATAFAQSGKIYGTKPSKVEVIEASKLEGFMGGKARINTEVKGKIVKVTNSKGGWFSIDAGNGKMISAHFKNIGTNLPASIAGKTVIAEGTASKQFSADDKQHYVSGTGDNKAAGKGGIDFEVTGLEVE